MTMNYSVKQILAKRGIAVHPSWISLDPVEGCPARCLYCFLSPDNKTSVKPRRVHEISELLDRLALLDEIIYGKTGIHISEKIPICLGNQTDFLIGSLGQRELIEILSNIKSRLNWKNIVLISKGKMTRALAERIITNCDRINFIQTLAFNPSAIEKGAPSSEERLESMSVASAVEGMKCLHYWRPITSSSSPDLETVVSQVKAVKATGAAASALFGLVLTPRISDQIRESGGGNELLTEETGTVGYGFSSGLVPNSSKEAVERVVEVCREYSHPAFLKTSCMMSYSFGCRDYTALFSNRFKDRRCRASQCPESQRKRCAKISESHEEDFIENTAAELFMGEGEKIHRNADGRYHVNRMPQDAAYLFEMIFGQTVSVSEMESRMAWNLRH